MTPENQLLILRHRFSSQDFSEKMGEQLPNHTIRSIAITKDNLSKFKYWALYLTDKPPLTIQEQWEKRISGCDVMMGFYSTYTNQDDEEEAFVYFKKD